MARQQQIWYNKREESLLCYYYPNTRVHKLSQNLEEPFITVLDKKGAILIIYKQPSPYNQYATQPIYYILLLLLQ